MYMYMLKLWTCTISNSTPYQNYWNYEFRFERRDVYIYVHVHVCTLNTFTCMYRYYPYFYALRIEPMLHKYNIIHICACTHMLLSISMVIHVHVCALHMFKAIL